MFDEAVLAREPVRLFSLSSCLITCKGTWTNVGDGNETFQPITRRECRRF